MNLKEKFIAFLGVLGQYVSVLFREALQAELTVVVPLARKLVAEVAMDPTLVTSSDKRHAVMTELVSQLAPRQKKVGEDVIRLAIELAYQDFKITPPPSTATTVKA